MLRISSNHIARIALSAAAFAVCQTTLIAPAHALKLEGFSVKQSGARPEVHVRISTGRPTPGRRSQEVTSPSASITRSRSKLRMRWRRVPKFRFTSIMKTTLKS